MLDRAVDLPTVTDVEIVKTDLSTQNQKAEPC